MKRNQRGYTAVEVAVAGTIMLFIAGGSVSMMKTGSNSWKGVVSEGKKQKQTQGSLHRVMDTLETAINVTIDTSDANHDKVKFQRPIGKLPDGRLEYGAFVHVVEDGQQRRIPKKGYWTEYRVENVTMPNGKTKPTLIAMTLNADGSAVIGDKVVLAENVDNTWSGRKGFGVSHSGGMFSVNLRVGNWEDGRTELKSSCTKEDIDLTNVDNTANSYAGLDSSVLNSRIVGLQVAATLALGAPFQDDILNAVDEISEARDALDSGELDQAMRSMQDAVRALEQARNNGMPAFSADPALDDLTNVSRQYLADAIGMATAQGVGSAAIDSANQKIGEGDSKRTAGLFSDAVGEYQQGANRLF